MAACALAFAATTVSGLTTLYDLPVSNHGARVRLVLYKKGLESAVKIVSPQELGGLRSDEYLALSPQGKMPLLVEDDGTSVWESDAICRHLLDKHADAGPSLWPSTLTSRTSRLLSQMAAMMWLRNSCTWTLNTVGALAAISLRMSTALYLWSRGTKRKRT